MITVPLFYLEVRGFGDSQNYDPLVHARAHCSCVWTRSPERHYSLPDNLDKTNFYVYVAVRRYFYSNIRGRTVVVNLGNLVTVKNVNKYKLDIKFVKSLFTDYSLSVNSISNSL